MPYLEANGANIYYRVDGSGSPIVLVHGRASNHLSWMHQVADLSRDHTVVTFDLRGFGGSYAAEGQDTSMHSHPEDLAALIEHLDLDSVSLVGHAMGGFAVLGYAFRHPERVSTLVLASTPAGINDRAVMDSVAKTRVNYSTIEYPARNFRPGFIEARPELVYQWAAGKDAGPQYPREFLAPLFDGGGPSADELASFAVPTLVLYGQYDCVMSAESADRIGQLIPGAEVIEIEDCGHCAYYERPLFYNRAIRDFVAKQRG